MLYNIVDEKIRLADLAAEFYSSFTNVSFMNEGLDNNR